MKNPNIFCSFARSALRLALVCSASLLIFSQTATAGGWNNIEPLKSRRADVERILGQPLVNQPGEEGTLHFKVAGGTVTVTFVTARFISTKKLDPDLVGTVLQVVLQHERSSDTPESMDLKGKSGFEREDKEGGIIYRNLREGIAYTFFGGRLITSRFSPSASQLGRARKG
jgi:hypothetical protein